MPKTFVCDYPNCGKSFTYTYNIERHKRIHCEYEKREYGCPFSGCPFRSNQQSGLKVHINSQHHNLRSDCGICSKSYSDPSSLSKHRRKAHGVGVKAPLRNPPVVSGLDHLAPFSTRASPNMSTPPPDGPSTGCHYYETRRSASRSASPGPSSSSYRPLEHHGGFHPVTDVPTERRSIGPNTQMKHQAYDANPEAAAPDLISPQLYPQEPLIDHRPESLPPATIQEGTDLEAGHDRHCHCWDCEVGPLTLAPIRGRREKGMQARPLIIEFSYPGAGHVARSDQQWMLPPTNNGPSPVYSRPNPQMLFDL